MRVLPENPTPKKRAAPKTIRGPAHPCIGAQLALIEIPLSQVIGLDPDIANFFIAQDFSFETVTDFQVWSKEAARWSYAVAPMVLIKRNKGYAVLGSGRAWRIAQAVFTPGESVPALVMTDVKRLPIQAKFQIVAAELFGLCADFRTRPNLPARLLNLWKQMNSMGVDSIFGNDAKGFSRGTGYSLRALKPVKATKSPSTAPDREPENSARAVVDPARAAPDAPGADK